MKQKILFLLISNLLSCYVLYAQGETTHWYFGTNSGMDFTDMYTINNATINGTAGQTLSGIPRFDSGPINTDEGCFSMSDKNGNFLFASDGMKVYNKNKAQMPHGAGLKGHPSATQSGIVIPRPTHPNNYYIVTSSERQQTSVPLYYYEVDLTLDDDKGDVLGPYTGNVPNGIALNLGGVYSDGWAGENIAAVGHVNGIDYWLIHRLRNYFFIWLVTKDGISPTPYASYPIGYDLNISGLVPYGHMKFSADGKYIANIGGNRITVAKFDNSTSNISDIVTYQVGTNATTDAYGIVFSPNNKYLYYTFFDYSHGFSRLDLQKLFNGETQTPLVINTRVANIQIGPDNRIYGNVSNWLSYAFSDYRDLYIVLNPDDENIDTAKITNYFPVGAGSHLSWPTFTASFYSSSDIETTPQLPACFNKEITFSFHLSTGSGPDRATRLEWDFGDGSPIVPENDMDKFIFSQKRTYKKRGNYTLTITPYRQDLSGNYIAMTDKIKTMDVKINSCVLPVNHNISAMGYYD